MLVSIIVVTFNSEEYITETLESIRLQTYNEIELIISDDYSGDATLEKCQSWLDLNSKRFVRTKLLNAAYNTGAPASCNRGLKDAKGEWIKFCAGDDALKNNCIEDNVNWIASHTEIRALFSRIELYREIFKSENLLNTSPSLPYSPNGVLAQGRTAESQYKMLLLSDRIHYTPSVFLHRDTLFSIGCFDQRFKLLEDYPLWLNLTSRGYKLHFMSKLTVKYRMHSRAINNTGIPSLINYNYFRLEDFRRIYTYPNLPVDIRFYQRFNWFSTQIFRIKWINKNKTPNRILMALLTRYLNPFSYYIFLKKHFIKNLKYNEFYT